MLDIFAENSTCFRPSFACLISSPTLVKSLSEAALSREDRIAWGSSLTSRWPAMSMSHEMPSVTWSPVCRAKVICKPCPEVPLSKTKEYSPGTVVLNTIIPCCILLRENTTFLSGSNTSKLMVLRLLPLTTKKAPWTVLPSGRLMVSKSDSVVYLGIKMLTNSSGSNFSMFAAHMAWICSSVSCPSKLSIGEGES